MRTVTEWERSGDFLFLMPMEYLAAGRHDFDLYMSYYLTMNHPLARQMKDVQVLDDRVYKSATLPPIGTLFFDKSREEYYRIEQEAYFQNPPLKQRDVYFQLEQGYGRSVSSAYLCDRFDIVRPVIKSGYVLDTTNMWFYEIDQERPEGFISETTERSKSRNIFIKRDDAVVVDKDIPKLRELGQKKVEHEDVAELFYLFLNAHFGINQNSYVWIALASNKQLMAVLKEFHRVMDWEQKENSKTFLRERLLQWLS